MIAHFVGGPLHGQDMEVDPQQHDEVRIMLTPKLEAAFFDTEKDSYPLPEISYSIGIYKRLQGEQYGNTGIFTWRSPETAHRFIIEVDTYSEADPKLVRSIVEWVAAHIDSVPGAFQGGIKGAKID